MKKLYYGRPFKKFIGTVQRGSFNRYLIANFEQSAAQDLEDCFLIIYPRGGTKSRILIRSNNLYIAELIWAIVENGCSTIDLDTIESQNGINHGVGSFSKSA